MSIKLKILLSMITIVLILAIFTILYFLFADIESKEPIQIEDVCDVEIENYQGRKVFIVTPKNKQIGKTKILYFHGGAYMAEMMSYHWEFIKEIAIDTNSTIIIPDYPLTPKYNYKDVYNMVEPLYKEIIKKVDTQDLILMGDSAGGGLALGLLEKISKEDDTKMPQKTILISPWIDVRLENPKIDEVQKLDKDLNKDTLKLAGIAYAGGEENLDDFLVNPIDGDLSKLKNIVIFTGTNDILNPDVYKLEEKAKEQGTNIKINEYNGAGHIWIVNKKGKKDLIEKGYQDLINETEVDGAFLSQGRNLLNEK